MLHHQKFLLGVLLLSGNLAFSATSMPDNVLLSLLGRLGFSSTTTEQLALVRKHFGDRRPTSREEVLAAITPQAEADAKLVEAARKEAEDAKAAQRVAEEDRARVQKQMEAMEESGKKAHEMTAEEHLLLALQKKGESVSDADRQRIKNQGELQNQLMRVIKGGRVSSEDGSASAAGGTTSYGGSSGMSSTGMSVSTNASGVSSPLNSTATIPLHAGAGSNLGSGPSVVHSSPSTSAAAVPAPAVKSFLPKESPTLKAYELSLPFSSPGVEVKTFYDARNALNTLADPELVTTLKNDMSDYMRHQIMASSTKNWKVVFLPSGSAPQVKGFTVLKEIWSLMNEDDALFFEYRNFLWSKLADAYKNPLLPEFTESPVGGTTTGAGGAVGDSSSAPVATKAIKTRISQEAKKYAEQLEAEIKKIADSTSMLPDEKSKQVNALLETTIERSFKEAKPFFQKSNSKFSYKYEEAGIEKLAQYDSLKNVIQNLSGAYALLKADLKQMMRTLEDKWDPSDTIVIDEAEIEICYKIATKTFVVSIEKARLHLKTFTGDNPIATANKKAITDAIEAGLKNPSEKISFDLTEDDAKKLSAAQGVKEIDGADKENIFSEPFNAGSYTTTVAKARIISIFVTTATKKAITSAITTMMGGTAAASGVPAAAAPSHSSSSGVPHRTGSAAFASSASAGAASGTVGGSSLEGNDFFVPEIDLKEYEDVTTFVTAYADNLSPSTKKRMTLSQAIASNPTKQNMLKRIVASMNSVPYDEVPDEEKVLIIKELLEILSLSFSSIPKLRYNYYMRQLLSILKEKFPEGSGETTAPGLTKEQFIYLLKDAYRVYDSDMFLYKAADFYGLYQIMKYAMNTYAQSGIQDNTMGLPSPNVPYDFINTPEIFSEGGFANEENYPGIKIIIGYVQKGKSKVMQKIEEDEDNQKLNNFKTERKPLTNDSMSSWILALKDSELSQEFSKFPIGTDTVLREGLKTMSLDELRALRFVTKAYGGSSDTTDKNGYERFKDMIREVITERKSDGPGTLKTGRWLNIMKTAWDHASKTYPSTF
ncbi:MAG: hypothetical protein FJZ62_06275 [Chlamydiae bacterium]|nr:hypothetical protein [Chlamydiota bacterium]